MQYENINQMKDTILWNYIFFFVGGQYQWILWLTLTNLRPYEF